MQPPSSPLTFSIITPTYNRPLRLAGFLESLRRLDYPKDRFEVILVDDGSDVNLEPVTARFRGLLNVVLLRQSHGGVARGRHVGATAAQGGFLAFTDDDCTPSPGWLRNLEKALEFTPNCAAGGYTENALPDNPFATASQSLISYLYERFNADPRQATFFAGNNMALPRDLYVKIGGLDVTWPMCGEDRDLCARWREHGYPMVYVRDAIVYHAHDLNLHRFWKQHFNYGRGARRFRKARSRRGGEGSCFEGLSFYFGLPLAAFRYAPGGRSLLVFLLLLLSQVSNTAGFVREWIRPSDSAPVCQLETAL